MLTSPHRRTLAHKMGGHSFDNFRVGVHHRSKEVHMAGSGFNNRFSVADLRIAHGGLLCVRCFTFWAGIPLLLWSLERERSSHSSVVCFPTLMAGIA